MNIVKTREEYNMEMQKTIYNLKKDIRASINYIRQLKENIDIEKRDLRQNIRILRGIKKGVR